MPSNKRTIPEIRTRLREIAEESDMPELNDLADETYRKPPVRRAAHKSKKLTPALAAEIRMFARENPKMHQQDIATKFGVNHGRVSEAMNYEV